VSSRGRHTRSKRDWSSDVCSSDLTTVTPAHSIPRPCLPVEFHIGRYARVFVWRSGGGLIKNFRWRADTQDRLERSRTWWRTLVPSKMGEIWGRVSSQKLQLGIV